MVKSSIASILVGATILRLLTSFLLFPRNTTTDNDNFLADALVGPGLLPAIGAAVLDPVHTWDHLGEACFWLNNSPPSLWKEGMGGDAAVGYNAIYTPGTRIGAAPLVVAFLGETLVCTNGSTLLWIIQNILPLIADAIGAYCIYQLGKQILVVENDSNEAEMERQTKINEMNEGEGNDDLVIPGILRPERGWIFGVSSKIMPPDIIVDEDHAANGAKIDDNQQTMEDENSGTSTPSSLDKHPILAFNQLPIAISILYYCNPISMLANATGSLRSLWDALLLLSFYYATMPQIRETKEGIPIKIPSATKAAFSLALATYADVGYAMYLLPILVWRGLFRDANTSAKIQKRQNHDWKMVIALYTFYLGSLHFLAALLVGGDSSSYRNVMIQTMLHNVAFVQQDDSGSVPGPNMGLHWYMFVQMFDRFRPYFTVFVAGVPAMFAIPLVTRLHRYPSVVAASFQLLWAIFRPTTTAHTLMLGLHLAALNPRTIIRMRDPSIIAFVALPVPMLLFMTFHRMWLVIGNGNPNYMFFQCFTYGIFVTIITTEFVSASVKRDKVRRMIEKGTIKKLMKENEGIEETEKEVQKDGQSNGTQKEAREMEGRSGVFIGEKASENGDEDGIEQTVAEEDSEQIDDADDRAEPVVVFL